MKELTVKLYSFDELSEEAQNNVINAFRDDAVTLYTDTAAYEIGASVEAFCELAGITAENAYYGYKYTFKHTNSYSEKQADETGAKGWRMINSLADNIIYLSRWGTKKTYRKNGKTRMSKVNYHNLIDNYPLTGVYCDYDILRPIQQYLISPQAYKTKSYNDIITECLDAASKLYEDEVTTAYTREAIAGYIEANHDEDFDEQGNYIRMF